MVFQEQHLTKEWVKKKLGQKGVSQFDIVNHLIDLAKIKVARGEHDEYTAERQNIAIDVIEDVALGREPQELPVAKEVTEAVSSEEVASEVTS